MMTTAFFVGQPMKPTLPLKEAAQILLCLLEKGVCEEHVTWITPASLQQHNTISSYTVDNSSLKKESLLICKEDILIKRVNPYFVNYVEEIEENVYAHSNLFIIRTHKEFCAKYIAYMLNEAIARYFVERTHSSSSLVPMTFKELQKITIPLLFYEEQERIGNAWFYSMEKLKLSKKLAELEFTKESQLLKRHIFGDK